MIRIIDNFLTNEECNKYIELINNFIMKKNIPFSNSANNFNHKYTDINLSQEFYDKCIEKNVLENIDTLGPNKLIMVSKYQKGENFGLHTDTGLYYNIEDQTKTRYTLLIYLNDDFDGGKTIFYTDNFEISKTISPKKGSCLLFDIDLWHEGKEVLNGTKYWIGIEIIGKFT